MIAYRIGKWKYLEDLTGIGAKLYGGRWNREGLPVLYASGHLSLAVLELLANQVRKLVDDTYGYIEIDIPEECSQYVYGLEDLDPKWRNEGYDQSTVDIGSEWLVERSSLLLSVPSAVLQQERNILINPHHPEFSKIRIKDKNRLELDGRVYAGSNY